MKSILIIFGTRPEVIKIAPLALELAQYPDKYNVVLCNTEQQKELSNQTLTFFGLNDAISLDIMSGNQTLPHLQARLMDELSGVFHKNHYDAVIVQGDTMSAFCGALAGFYANVPVFHVEAGLRSYSLSEPFPEEGLRQMISRITRLHFAPTQKAVTALQQEAIPDKYIHFTGNTVIDALKCLSSHTLDTAFDYIKTQGIELEQKPVLVTAHRRENHGERLLNIIQAIQTLAQRHPERQFVLPVHPNPNVRQHIEHGLGAISNIRLIPPADYPVLVMLMKHASLILTDSGGIQEEAPTFQVPVLVMRYETERMEGVEQGFAKLVGADTQLILEEAEKALAAKREGCPQSEKANPYGDGKAAQRICSIIDTFFAETQK